MTDFLQEAVPPMPPTSVAAIEAVARGFLQSLAPEMLQKPGPLDIVRLIDKGLPPYGIHITPASSIELGKRYAATDPGDGGDIEVLLHEDLYEDLYVGGRRANLARATVAHELGHVTLHVPVLRRRMLYRGVEALRMNRVARGELPPYEDPEWQAWTLAGYLLMPRAMVVRTGSLDVDEIAETFEVSPQMARQQLRRLAKHGRST